MKKIAFTLIELLVVIAIIGIFSAIAVVYVESARQNARASNIASQLVQIEKAFTLKALNEGITDWWDGNEFPDSSSWVVYLSDLDEEISDFLPITPDIPGVEWATVKSYSYTNDGQDSRSYTTCDNGPSLSHSQLRYTVQRGVNIWVNLKQDWDSDAFQDIYTALDNTFDNGDGPICGRIRTYGFEGSQHNNIANFPRTGLYFRIDDDQIPNF